MEENLGVINFGRNVFVFNMRNVAFGAYVALLENDESKSSQKFVFLQNYYG